MIELITKQNGILVQSPGYKVLENTFHVFCECDKVQPIWTILQDVINMINDKLHANYDFNYFDYMFGIPSDSFLSVLFSCCKFFIYKCKFQNVIPNYVAFKSFFDYEKKSGIFNCQKETETVSTL